MSVGVHNLKPSLFIITLYESNVLEIHNFQWLENFSREICIFRTTFLQDGKISVRGEGKEEILGMREWNIQKH